MGGEPGKLLEEFEPMPCGEMMSEFEEKRVEFDVDGTHVVGILYLPKDQEPVAGVVFTGPLTSMPSPVRPKEYAFRTVIRSGRSLWRHRR